MHPGMLPAMIALICPVSQVGIRDPVPLQHVTATPSRRNSTANAVTISSLGYVPKCSEEVLLRWEGFPDRS